MKIELKQLTKYSWQSFIGWSKGGKYGKEKDISSTGMDADCSDGN